MKNLLERDDLRVLFFGTYFQFRGKETYISDEIDAVIKNYPNIKYVIYNVGPYYNVNRLVRYSKNVLWIQRGELKNLRVLILFLKDMIKIFTKFKPHVIHSIYVIESFIMGIFGKIFRVPSILHSRGMDINFYPFVSIKSNILARVTAKLNNIILTVSKVMKLDTYKLNIPHKKVIALYDGIDYSLFNPINKKLNKKNEKLEILHVGQFNLVKKHDLMIEVCKELRDNRINFHFTFTGYGFLEDHLKSLIEKYNLENWVCMAGYTDHDKIPEFLAKGDLYIQPSISEGMPISVLEAMSMNLPVILTRVGGMPELIYDNGGIIIDVNNKKQLYDAILHYVNNPMKREADGIRNGKFVRDNFNWDRHAKVIYNIYLKLSKKRSRIIQINKTK